MVWCVRRRDLSRDLKEVRESGGHKAEGGADAKSLWSVLEQPVPCRVDCSLSSVPITH